jgi:hypothetical protein
MDYSVKFTQSVPEFSDNVFRVLFGGEKFFRNIVRRYKNIVREELHARHKHHCRNCEHKRNRTHKSVPSPCLPAFEFIYTPGYFSNPNNRYFKCQH